MAPDLHASTALVIGGSGGIGLGIASRLADHGATVHITGTRSAPESYDHVHAPERFTYHQLDVTDSVAVDELFPGLRRLDVLVCSHGTVAYGRREYDLATFRSVLDVNLVGVMACCTRFHDALAAASGAVVVVASTSSFIATPGQPAYGASKGGLRTLVASLAYAWAGDGIRVNGIAPGFVDTRLTKRTARDRGAYEATLARIPMGRWGTPEEMGDAAVFLASSMSSYVTGQLLLVDGGITLL